MLNRKQKNIFVFIVSENLLNQDIFLNDMKLKRITYGLILSFIGVSDLMAQGPPGPGPPPPHPELPIDGGLGYLIITAALIGVYHIKKRKPSN